ncbi:MAG: 2-keto-4-pentenoate hydratase, partial [Proteobacteria bacterium]|nr:2-keto-4-pentenoate hydratase [Pseudomonadota bacterium]
MKLATLKQGGRDGTLVVVSRDLTLCQPVPDIARTLQAALDDWEAAAPRLRDVYEALNNGHARHA